MRTILRRPVARMPRWEAGTKDARAGNRTEARDARMAAREERWRRGTPGWPSGKKDGDAGRQDGHRGRKMETREARMAVGEERYRRGKPGSRPIQERRRSGSQNRGAGRKQRRRGTKIAGEAIQTRAAATPSPRTSSFPTPPRPPGVPSGRPPPSSRP